MRKPIIAANWKMNMTHSEASSFLGSFLLEVAEVSEVEIVIVPAFTSIGKVSELLNDTQNVKVGAQNMHPEASGAFTGEISAAMLRELYVRYVVLGHSERRTLFGETDAFINQKLKAVIAASMRGILCVGETLEERDANKVERVLETQLKGSLEGIPAEDYDEIVIAYEPVWAIGTGRTATPEQAQEAHAFIRKTVSGLVGEAAASKLRIQYGGSVKPANTAELMSQPDIDGALVGGASLEARSFAEIIQKTAGLKD